MALSVGACGPAAEDSSGSSSGAVALATDGEGSAGGEESAAGHEPGAGPVASGPSCDAFEQVGPFATALRETSGLARSAHANDVLWTHNDSGGEPALTAIDRRGNTLGTVRVDGARNRDWEALSGGPCPQGDCLFIGDIGDNLNERDPVTIYRIAEPAVDAGRSEPAVAWTMRYPGGPRDAEGLAVHPTTGDLWIVAKGRAHPIELFRVPLPEGGGETRAEAVASLTDRPVPLPRMVTGATFTPDGRWLLIRSYIELFFLPVDDAGIPGPVANVVSLEPLSEQQGEAVEAFSGGVVYFTSEAGSAGGRPTLGRARCDFATAGTEAAP